MEAGAEEATQDLRDRRRVRKREALCVAREREYVLALETLESTYPDTPRVVVFRMQKQPEGLASRASLATRSSCGIRFWKDRTRAN